MRAVSAISVSSLTLRRRVFTGVGVGASSACLNAITNQRRYCSTTNGGNEQHQQQYDNDGSASSSWANGQQGGPSSPPPPPPPPSKFVRTAAAVVAPAPLPNFETHYEQGTGRFTLIGNGPSEGVFISCVVPSNHKPRLLQLDDAGDRIMMGASEGEGVGQQQHNFSGEDNAKASAFAHRQQLLKEQQAYHKHLWTSAKQRLNVNRRKLQRRKDAAAEANLLANRAATLDAFLQQQYNNKHPTGGGSGSGNDNATLNALNRAIGGGSTSSTYAKIKGRHSLGKMTMLCPPRDVDQTPPAPAHATPPPPSSNTTSGRDQDRYLNRAGDINPSKALVADGLEGERDLHRRQYLAVDAIVAEDGAEQVGVRFRVGLLTKRKAPAAAASGEVDGTTSSDPADVIADFMMASSTSADVSAASGTSSSNSNRKKNTPAALKFSSHMLHLSCSTIAPAAALVIDGAHFYNNPTTFLETSLEHTHQDLQHYLGPQMHQRNLANYACNREGVLNRYSFPSRSGHLDAVSTTHFFRPDVFPSVCLNEHAAHLPVHTVPPVLHDAMRHSVATRGVDDELALYVHQYAQYVFAHERLLWRQRLVSFLKRGRLVAPSSAPPTTPPTSAEDSSASA